MSFDFTLWITVAFVLSLSLNVFLYWYQQKLLSKFLFISENLNDLVAVIDNYKLHLKKIYEMEMFYGDENIKHLMEHTNSMLELLKDYEDVYSIALPLEVEQEGEKEIETEETEAEEEVLHAEKDVFYAGTRRRDS